MKPKNATVEECATCRGRGRIDPPCESCGGCGRVGYGLDDRTMDCPDCDSESCPTCDGSGKVEIQPKRRKR